MKIIGMAAQLAGGKDTIADYLAKNLEGKWHRDAFANAVKQVFCDSFQVGLGFVEKWKRKDENPPTFDKPMRQALQFIGDGFRQISGNIWIFKLMQRVDSLNSIISDERYINEAKAIKARFGLNILIWRPGFENNDPNPSEAQIKVVIDWAKENWPEGPRPQEVPEDVSYFDFFFINDSVDLDALHKKIDKLLVPFIENYFVDN